MRWIVVDSQCVLWLNYLFIYFYVFSNKTFTPQLYHIKEWNTVSTQWAHHRQCKEHECTALNTSEQFGCSACSWALKTLPAQALPTLALPTANRSSAIAVYMSSHAVQCLPPHWIMIGISRLWDTERTQHCLRAIVGPDLPLFCDLWAKTQFNYGLRDPEIERSENYCKNSFSVLWMRSLSGVTEKQEIRKWFKRSMKRRSKILYNSGVEIIFHRFVWTLFSVSRIERNDWFTKHVIYYRFYRTKSMATEMDCHYSTVTRTLERDWSGVDTTQPDSTRLDWTRLGTTWHDWPLPVPNAVQSNQANLYF